MPLITDLTLTLTLNEVWLLTGDLLKEVLRKKIMITESEK